MCLKYIYSLLPVCAAFYVKEYAPRLYLVIIGMLNGFARLWEISIVLSLDLDTWHCTLLGVGWLLICLVCV